MRKDWEYKKLGECTNIEYGTRVVQKKDGGTIYPVYGGGGETFRIDKYNRENCLIIARFAMSKCCVRYVNGRFFLNDSGLSVKASNYFHQDFLNHCMVSLNDTIYNLGKGAAQRNLDIKAFKQIPIPIPPKPTQLAIVAELDKINELIQLKKQQLKDYDQLAQSIFYEMFGDPVENEKGWKVKKLEEAVAASCTISYGIVQPGEHVLNGVPIVRPIDLGNTFIKTKDLKCTTIEISNGYSRTILTGDEILVCVRGTTGILSLATSELKGCNVTRGITPLLFDINNKWFMYAQLKTPSIQHIIANNTKGIALKQINMGDFRNIRIILPPLPLQQQFAARIEAIERQKQQVSETIKDLETLLASRMQYWFD